jgi:hypothetical protein
MGKVIVMNHVTLDGVMQGPGRADEDTRDGFEHGGWAVARGDETMGAKMGERMGEDRAFLFGRRTYEEMLASWNAGIDRQQESKRPCRARLWHSLARFRRSYYRSTNQTGRCTGGPGRPLASPTARWGWVFSRASVPRSRTAGRGR